MISTFKIKIVPHPENVPGDFYVEDGCCLSCGMPIHEAPDLFAWTKKDDSCVVKKQPSTQNELDQMLKAFSSQDIGCLRYKGRDKTIQEKLISLGEGQQCDFPTLGKNNGSITSHTLNWLLGDKTKE